MIIIPDSAHLDSNFGGRDGLADIERGGIGDFDAAARKCSGLDLAEGERVGLGDLADRLDTRLIGSWGGGRSGTGEDPELTSRDVVEDGDVQSEILGEDFLGDL